jgi:hypothetical protein
MAALALRSDGAGLFERLNQGSPNINLVEGRMHDSIAFQHAPSFDAPSSPECRACTASPAGCASRGPAQSPLLELPFAGPLGTNSVRLSCQLAPCGRWIPHGVLTVRDPRGQILAQGNFVDGQRHGLWREWHTNGRLAVVGSYVKQREVGTWQYFDERGRLLDVEVFSERADVAQPVYARAAAQHRIRPGNAAPVALLR